MDLLKPIIYVQSTLSFKQLSDSTSKSNELMIIHFPKTPCRIKFHILKKFYVFFFVTHFLLKSKSRADEFKYSAHAN